jgi:flagellar biogenesis protein FliO
MKVVQILFLAWFIVFAFWLFRQFARSNRDYDKTKK